LRCCTSLAFCPGEDDVDGDKFDQNLNQILDNRGIKPSRARGRDTQVCAMATTTQVVHAAVASKDLASVEAATARGDAGPRAIQLGLEVSSPFGRGAGGRGATTFLLLHAR